MNTSPVLNSLEHYLAGAPIEHVRPLVGGGGHPHKMALVLRGGVGVVAKVGDSEQMMKQVRRETAAWVLAMELDLPHLVPATVLRPVPVADDETNATSEGSVQILWPRFRMALEDTITPDVCAPETSWPIAVFDLLLANTDRKEDNWGTIDGLPRAVLIDHGHAFEASDSHSMFVDLHREERVPDALLSRIRALLSSRATSRLWALLDDGECTAVFERADAILKSSALSIR